MMSFSYALLSTHITVKPHHLVFLLLPKKFAAKYKRGKNNKTFVLVNGKLACFTQSNRREKTMKNLFSLGNFRFVNNTAGHSTGRKTPALKLFEKINSLIKSNHLCITANERSVVRIGKRI